jgi:hypothetical protein
MDIQTSPSRRVEEWYDGWNQALLLCQHDNTQRANHRKPQSPRRLARSIIVKDNSRSRSFQRERQHRPLADP